MIKESKLIGRQVPMPYGWREFSPLDLFEVYRGVRITTSQREPGNIPLVTAGNEHAGISDYINNPEQKLFNKSGVAITIDMFGNCFTRNYSFKADDNIIVLSNLEFSEQTMLFLTSVLQKLTYAQFNYGAQFRLNSLKSLKLSLPVTQDGQPDYGWMSAYIRELENQRIRELENQRIRELDMYLQVTGLDDTTLTDNELQVLEQWRQHEKFGGGTLLTKRFKVGELFDLENSPVNNVNDLLVGQVSAGEGSYGVSDMITTDLYDNHIITISKLGQAFYHNQNVTWTDDVLGLKLKYGNDMVGLFLSTIIDKQTRHMSSYGHQFRMKRLHELVIELPVTNDDTPDYEFMEIFIRAQEKLSMTQLSDFRAKQIAETKALTRP